MAEGDLRTRWRPVPVARSRLPWEAPSQRRQVDVLAEVPRGKPSALEPDFQESPRRPRKVVDQAVRNRPRRLPDQHNPGLFDQPRPNRVRSCEVSRHLTRTTRHDLSGKRLELKMRSGHRLWSVSY